ARRRRRVPLTITRAARERRRWLKVQSRVYQKSPPLRSANPFFRLFTRHGCNAGGCHGKASGQNGFKLSLFGFDPAFDYNAIVKEARGRRVFPGSPDNSLLLTKPSGRAPHGGGRRLRPDADDDQTLRRWVAQGTPLGDATAAASLSRLEVVPRERVLSRQALQQIAVLAHYGDGSVRDVTRLAQYQSNETAVAAVEDEGLVRTTDLAGEAAGMARYQGQVAVFRAPVPLRSEERRVGEGGRSWVA